MSFKSVSSQVDFPALEEKILKFWQQNQIFEKSVDERPEDKRYTFYDGPPFITGLPHYGSLLPSIVKDLFPRYKTMMGYRVRRVWGWDCHGLPAENKVEEQLGIKSKKEIEQLGVDKFIAACRNYVSTVSSEWHWYVDHVGRWVDMEHAYKTMDLPYMETVMWVFKQIYEKGLIYKGKKVVMFCTRCSTQLSNFEIAMDNSYNEVEDPSVFVKFPVKGKDNTYFLVWTTTPWTLPANLALAVNPDERYVVGEFGGEKLIVAKKLLEKSIGKGCLQKEEYRGEELVGWRYEPLYNFFKVGEKDYKVYSADFVSMDGGTGIVHIAPGFGEDDFELGQKEELSFISHVDDEGKFTQETKVWHGLYVKVADEKIKEDLKKRGLLFRSETIMHSYPFCYRCATPLIYKAVESWFLSVNKIKDMMLETNKNINWVPKHMKYGRFKKGIESAPDWNLSRSRYWGSPVPIWECECGEIFVPGSIKELEESSGNEIEDLHKPEIDEIEIVCKKCAKLVKRVKEVLDCWFESGSMPYAQIHYPFENEKEFKEGFPADFITEYIAQTRGWFYNLHVISNALMKSECFKNVVVTGTLLGSDGRKMSKLFGNYPDPKELLEKYGGDALRLYLMSSPVMKGEDMNFYEEGVAENYRSLLIFWNTYKFFVDYATPAKWTPKSSNKKLTILDKWIISRLNQLIFELQESFENYDTIKITNLVKDFIISDFSTWYIRRSRDRVALQSDEEDKNTCLSVMCDCLVTLAKLAAPLAPFITEEMYKNLTGEESVHLQDYPQADQSMIDEDLITQMALVRKIAEKAHAKRKAARFKLRQPLASLTYKYGQRIEEELEKILASELNVKTVEYEKSSNKEPEVELDTKITPQLREEGEARGLIRQIQDLRKKQNLTLLDKTKIETPGWPKSFQQAILQGTNSISITVGSTLKVVKI